MKKLEITKNECAILDYAGHICINDGAFYEDNNVLDMDTAGENAAIDHARLFLDSIQTYQECELLPSELLKQNKELREAFVKYQTSVNKYLENRKKNNLTALFVAEMLAEEKLNSKP